MSMLFSTIDKQAINVSMDISNDLPLIKGDRTKLMQLILNVVKNSVEAIDTNATEKNICIDAHRQNGHLILKVKDSGHGFDKQTGDQFFKRGFTTKLSGAGMGLYNCRAIVESHEGTIEMTSDGGGKGALTTIGFKI